MTNDPPDKTHADRLAAAIAAMHQLAADDLATMKDTLPAEARPDSLPGTSVLEYAYAGAFLSEVGRVGNHYSTRLWKIGTNELQTAHRFILAINERHPEGAFSQSIRRTKMGHAFSSVPSKSDSHRPTWPGVVMEKSYPRDPEWESMPDVGLEVWPDYSTDAGVWAEVEKPVSEDLANGLLNVPRSEERALSYRASALMASLARLRLCDDEPTLADMRLIDQQRKLIAMHLASDPRLREWLTDPAWLATCWSDAVASLGAIGLRIKNLPEHCPWDQDSLLDGAQSDGRSR